MNQRRRQVLRWLSLAVGTFLSSLAGLWQRAVAETKAEKIGTVADLDKNGFLTGQLADKTPVLVVRDPKDKEKLLALNVTCSHAGCASDYKDGVIVCPYHGSRFNLDGSVARGPARQPLKPLTVKVEGGVVLVAA